MNRLRKTVGALAGFALLMACYTALSRYFFPMYAKGWMDELVVCVMIWALWLSGGLLVMDGDHVRADFLRRSLSPDWGRRLARAGDALGLAFAMMLTYAGAMVVMLSVRLGETADSTLALPLWTYYAGLPVGMALMTWRYWRRLTRDGAP